MKVSLMLMGMSMVGVGWCWLRALRHAPQRAGVWKPCMALTLICLGALAFAAFVGGWLNARPMDDRGRERLFYSLGAVAAGKMPSTSAIYLFCAADESATPRIQAIHRGLVEHANAPVSIVEVSPAKQRPDSEDIPISIQLTARDLDRALAELPKDAVGVLVIDPPRDCSRMRLWRNANTCSRIFWLDLGQKAEVAAMVTRGALAGAAILNELADVNSTAISSDPAAAFAGRYQWLQPTL